MKSIQSALRCVATAIAAVSLLGACAGGNPLLVRSTVHGQVQGVDDAQSSGTHYWKGIPFARPPVGALRWRGPLDPEAWTGIRDATEFGNACAQYGRLYGPGANNKYDATIGTTLNKAVGSEDCLTLNIWRPVGPQTRLPVVLFIFGGSNVSGYTADPVYDGAMLAKTADVVVVTANYRLGIFGWLNLPQLKGGTNVTDDSGNFGTLDNIQALQFIKRNIANFGGDPNNVTVMGESAGAVNVYALMVSPMVVSANTKLFHKTIPMSGGISLKTSLPAGALPTVVPVESYLAQGNALLNNLLIADGKAADAASAQAYAAKLTSEQIAAYMRSKDPATLFNILLTKLAPAGQGVSGPIPEGIVVPADPIAAISAGNYMKVPVWASNTRDEGKLFGGFLALFGGPPAYLANDASLGVTWPAWPQKLIFDATLTDRNISVE